MIKLNITSLNEFRNRTQMMTPNTKLPILQYLKLDINGNDLLLTKSNLDAVYISKIKGSHALEKVQSVLIDEKIIYAFANEVKSSDEIQIDVLEKQVKLSQATQNWSFHKENLLNFPMSPPFEPNADSFTFGHDHTAAILVASSFTNDVESAGNQRFVHISNTSISAFNSHYFYCNNSFTNLPSMILTREQASIVGQFENLEVTINDNKYMFFNPADSSIFIFTRCEGNVINVTTVLERLESPGKQFEIYRNELTGFMSMANTVSETPIVDCTINKNEIKMIDANYNRNGERSISFRGDMDEFNFNSRLFLYPMKAVPYEIMACKTVQNCFIIMGANKDYYCFMGMAKK